MMCEFSLNQDDNLPNLRSESMERGENLAPSKVVLFNLSQ